MFVIFHKEVLLVHYRRGVMAEVEPISKVKVFMKIIVSIIKTTKILTRLNVYVISHVTNGVHNAHKPPSHIFCLTSVTLRDTDG